MALVLFDSNIVIDALKGIPQARDELFRYEYPAVSSITWIEVHAGASPAEQAMFQIFMSIFDIVHIDDAIMAEAGSIRRSSLHTRPRLALPDAIIKATANVTRRVMITRNTKDFRGPNVHIPYELSTTTTVNVINVRPPLQ